MTRTAHGLAAATYLAAALWAMRAVLPAPASLLAYPSEHDAVPGNKLIFSIDQAYEASAMLRNAHVLLTAPWRLLDGDCFPIPRAATLGEHMFGEGLAAALPYALTGEPLLAYNVVVVTWFAVAGIAMYALAWHWTGSAAAAFVAGLLFEILPVRIGDPQHPFIHADHWTPLVMLFLHRLVVSERWRDAIALVGASALQLLESAYNVLECGLVAGVYALVLLVHHRDRLGALLPKLVAAAVAIGLVAVAVLAPFAATRSLWGLGGGHHSMPLPTWVFLRGGEVYPGTVAVVLAAIGLVDRLRRGRAVPDDPRLAMLSVALLAVWLIGPGVGIRGVAFVRSPLFGLLEAGHLPLLEGLRGLHLVSQAAPLAVTFLAAWGVLALNRRLAAAGRTAVTAIAAAAACLEVFHPALARASFGRTVEMATVDLRPSDRELAVYATLVEGPVLDVPFTPNAGTFMAHVPHYALWRMYHQRRIAACATSLGGPGTDEIIALAGRLPDQGAADTLHAMGFRNVIVHEEFLRAPELARWRSGIWTHPPGGARLTPRGRGERHAAYALESPAEASPRLDALQPDPAAVPELQVGAAAPAAIAFALTNASAAPYRHPDPIQPSALTVRWRNPDGGPSLAQEVRMLLPLALAAGGRATRTITVAPPAPGRYEVTLELPGAPGRVLGRRSVRVIAQASAGTSAP